MVGARAWARSRSTLNGTKFDDETEEQTRERIDEALREDRLDADEPHARQRRLRRRSDRVRPAATRTSGRIAAQILGQAFVTAYNFIAANKDAVERIADAVIEKRELYGDELVRLLDAQNLKKPEIDWTKEESWPQM